MSTHEGSVTPLAEFVAPDDSARMLQGLPSPVPSPLRILGRLVALVLLAGGALLWAVPWVQTAAGSGQVVALHPADRVQVIHALVDGRIRRWFVEDGSSVRSGDPIVEISDIDPHLIERLRAERSALALALDAARTATATARIDYERQERLHTDGLSARKDYEAAKIRYQEMRARESKAQAALNKADIGLSRQSSQLVRAPQDGRIVQLGAGDSATVVAAGEAIATFAPAHVERAVEIFLSGLDAPLVEAGRSARVMFEGWPAVQFSGWPQASLGTFAATVVAVDPVAGPAGRFRALLAATPGEPWPPERYLRLGSQARAWISLERVRLGYELWRILNRFPPLPPVVPGTGP